MQLNFREQNVPDVESGIRRFSIRPRGKLPRNPEQNVHLFTGLRTKKCWKLGIAPCVGVTEMVFYLWNPPKRLGVPDLGVIVADEWELDLKDLARKDGFDSADDFRDFFLSMYKLKPGDTKVMEGIGWAKKGDWIWIKTWDDIPPEGK